MDPLDVCNRALCQYDRVDQTFTLSVWGEQVTVFPHQCKIESALNKPPHRYEVLDLFAIHYLLGAKATQIANSWISEKEVPGGATFFRGPHRIPTDMVSNRFANDIGGFKRRCEQLNGQPIRMAEAACTFKITPRIPVAALYWCGDDDFPAEFKILYDKTIQIHLATDIIYALAVGICQRLGAGVTASDT